MDYKLLILNLIILATYMSLWFVAARVRSRLDTVDTAWGLGFVLVGWVDFIAGHSFRGLLLALMVTIWGLRLASHIYRRNKIRDEDPRYKELADKWQDKLWSKAYINIFMLQGFLVWLISLPLDINVDHKIKGLGWLSILGVLVWLAGFIVESIADQQLSSYLKLKSRPKVMSKGLWRYSRHPNYFGELTQWWGIGLLVLQVRYGLLGLIGPLLLTVLIIFVSGIPPIEKRRSKDPEYKKYKARTSALVPWPPKQA